MLFFLKYYQNKTHGDTKFTKEIIFDRPKLVIGRADEASQLETGGWRTVTLTASTGECGGGQPQPPPQPGLQHHPHQGAEQ